MSQNNVRQAPFAPTIALLNGNNKMFSFLAASHVSYSWQDSFEPKISKISSFSPLFVKENVSSGNSFENFEVAAEMADFDREEFDKFLV